VIARLTWAGPQGIVRRYDQPHCSDTLQERIMKTDMQLQKDVIDELKWHPRTRDAEIGVAAKGGVVTLTGPVLSYLQRFEAARLVERVNGVRAVADEMQVRLPNASMRSDTDIAHAAVTAFKWHIDVPADKITAKVEEGWVTLHGSVDWQYEKDAAETAVRYLTGVKGVTNLITLMQPTVAPETVKRQIEAALKRSATVDAGRVSVESNPGGKVVLRGTLRSWTERSDVERAAWATPGVSTVDDEVAVGV
jgi:osmotically-inducible protein OsmY